MSSIITITNDDYLAVEDRGNSVQPHIFNSEQQFKAYAAQHRLITWVKPSSARRTLDAIDHRGETIDEPANLPAPFSPAQLKAAQKAAYAATHGPQVIERDYELGDRKLTLHKGELVALLIDQTPYPANVVRVAPWQVTFKVYLPDQPKPRMRTIEIHQLFDRVVTMTSEVTS